jgi:hypothetical protein
MTRWVLSLAAMLGGLLPVAANAHFVWLVQKTDGTTRQVHVYFSEDAEADDPSLLDRLSKLTVQELAPDAEPQAVKLTKGEESLVGTLHGAGPSFALAAHEYGVINRGDAKYWLFYYAKSGPALGDAAWTKLKPTGDLDVVPSLSAEGKLVATVTWQGKPLAKSEVTAVIPEVGDVKAESNEAGQAEFEIGATGLYAVRARMIDETPGEHDGKAYDSIRRYSTVTFQVPEKPMTTAAADSAAAGAVVELAALTPPVTSLGGAIAGNALYVYGGNLGSAHSYAKDGQSHELRKLTLDGNGKWETVAEGPGLQGLALVSHGDTLYRIGGFTAKNEEGEDNDLWSQASVTAFDTAKGEWRDLPDLPEARSSHDAAVLGDVIYVIGGWALQGKDNRQWHSTAWSLDLSADKPEWKALPAPPFERRALAVAAHDGKIYAIGGMQHEGGVCTKVDIFDPATQKWTEGPSIQGEGMEGFGASAFATGGSLFVSTNNARLQRLSADGSAWEIVRELPRGRFFHRMLPLDDHRFVLVGGANMEVGKFEEVDVISVR